MKIANNRIENNGQSNIANIYSQMKTLGHLFKKIMLVNPVEKREIIVNEYGLDDSHKSCKESCPLANDECGCICNETLSNMDERCRFTFNSTEAYLVISHYVKLKYKDYVLVLIMRLNPKMSFGGYKATEAIECISEVSSNIVMDPLTEIFNRKYYNDKIDYLIQSSMKKRQPLALANIDIDNFKKFNDTYGHDFGDKVLKKVAEKMREAISVLPEAYPIRMGGDEFLIIGVNVDKNRFKAIMNKLCIMIDDSKLPFNASMVGIKISIGVSEISADGISNSKELYDKADKQLYAAKEAGKGCVR